MKESRLFILFLFLSFKLNAQYDPTYSLRQAFGQNCSSSSSISDLALSQSQNLEEIIKAMKDDASCKGIAPLVGMVQDQMSAVHRVSNDIDALSEKQKKDLENSRIISELVSAIQTEQYELDRMQQEREEASGGGPVTIEDRDIFEKQELINKYHEEVAILQSNMSIDSESNQRKRNNQINQIQALESSTSNLLNSLSQSNSCTQQNPYLAGQVIGQVMSIASLANPGVYGHMLLGTGNIVNHLMDNLRSDDFKDALGDIQGDKIREAYGCALEGLAATHCQARDTLNMVDEVLKAENSSYAGCSFVVGARSIGKNLTQFMSWIEELGKVSSQFSLDNQNQISELNRKINTLEEADDTITTSLINVRKRNLEGLEAIEPVLGIARNITIQSTGDPKVSSAFDRDPCGLYEYFISGAKIEDITKPTLLPGRPYATSLNDCQASEKPIPSLGEVYDRWSKFRDFERQKLKEKLRDLKLDDPKILISKAEEEVNGVSPLGTLEDISRYIENINLDDVDGLSARTNQNFKEKVLELRAAISESIFKYNDSENVDNKDLIQSFSNKYSDGKIVLSLSEILKMDVKRKRLRGEYSEAAAMVMQTSLIGDLGELVKNLNDASKLRDSSRVAQRQTESNISAMTSVFQNSFEEVLKDLQNDAKDSSSDVSRRKNARSLLAQSCLRTLLIPDTPSDFSNICEGSIYEGVDGERFIYNMLKKRPYKERACLIYDYQRKLKLNENINQR